MMYNGDNSLSRSKEIPFWFLVRWGENMSLYKYETHLHTKEASACASVSGAEYVRHYKEAGYAGIIITDHFFNGNSGVPRNLPWAERVELFCLGYENAKREGDRVGLSVYFGWESYYDGTEFLIYGLTKEWMKSHPDMLSWSMKEQYQRVHEAGGLVVHAHPFRKRWYINEVRLIPEFIDAVEGINLGNDSHEFNIQAMAYAKEHQFPMTSGTDAHKLETMLGGVAFPKKLESIEDYIREIKEGTGYQLLPTIN